MNKELNKRIAIVIPHSAALKLLTDVLPIKKLKNNYDISIVCDKEIFSERLQHFCDSNSINLINFEFQNINNFNYLKRMLRNLRAYVYPAMYKNQTLIDFWRVFKHQNKKNNFGIKILILDILYQLSCKNRFIRNTLSKIECIFTNTYSIEKLFFDQKITHLFTTSFSGVDTNDLALLASKRRKIFSISYIQSWDNPSANGFSLCKPNQILSYSISMKKQIENFQDVESKNIYNIGAMQYSNWSRHVRKDNKIKKRTLKILYGGKSYKRFPYDHAYVKEIINCFSDLNIPIELVVRPHPFALRKTSNDKYYFKEIYKLLELIKKYDQVEVDLESVLGTKTIYQYDNSFNSMRDKLLEFDMVINVFTTLALEASILNIPAINIYYQNEDYRYFNFPSRYNMYHDERQFHNRQLVKAVPNISSLKEFKKIVRSILDNPNLYSSERREASKNIVGDIENSKNNFLKLMGVYI